MKHVIPASAAGLKQDNVVRTFFGLFSRRNAASSFNLVVSVLAMGLLANIASGQNEANAATKYAGFVIDAKSGRVLYSKNADARRYPASLTKMMTLYLVFEDLKRGKIKLNSRVKMSRHAASQPPSKLGIKPGKTFTVRQGIYALVTKSANDVATAMGEKLSGSEKAFARRMTIKARQLGMYRTTFTNANGLPDRKQVTTARDMSKLGLALREHFPKKFRYFKTRSFKYGRRRFPNHNRLLGRIKGVDGIKTGYTRASGFNLVSSVSRGNRRIIAVVLGGKTGRARNAQMARLISKYLPRATRGRSKTLIARAKPLRSNRAKVTRIAKVTPKPVIKKAPVIVAAVALPTNRPKSASKSIKPSRFEITEQTSSYASAIANAATIQAKLIELAAKSMPLPTPSPKGADPIKTGSVSKVKYVAMNQPVSKNRKGWQVQIGAAPSRVAALKLLSSARTKARTLLASADNYMEPVVKGKTTLIRARFAGFSSKRSARKACKYLKRKKIDCLAIRNN